MVLSDDGIRTLLTAVAIGISLTSLFFSRRSWLQSNRPIVTAFVTEGLVGNIGGVFNLVVANTGNRPATSIRLCALQDLSLILDESAPEKRKQDIQECFSEEAIIPLLRNGEELETAFGAVTNDPTNGKWLKYGAQIQVQINYSDLEGRTYVSQLPLRIYVRKGFGGSVWSQPY